MLLERVLQLIIFGQAIHFETIDGSWVIWVKMFSVVLVREKAVHGDCNRAGWVLKPTIAAQPFV